MKRARPLEEESTEDDDRWEYWDDRRSDIDNEISEDLFNQITTTATEIIMPTKVTKYYGGVYYNVHRKKWIAQFFRRCSLKEFSNEQDAIDYVKKVNSEMGWPVKNIVYKCGDDEYYCYLTKGQFMKFSYEHMHYVQDYVWNAGFKSIHNIFYAESTMGEKGRRKMVRYHCIVIPDSDKKQVVDHINRISLDNTTSNLRVASFKTNSINQKIRSDNKSGVCGVHRQKNSYIAYWVNQEGRECRKYFNINKFGEENAFGMAVDYRKEKEKTIEHYRIAYGNT